VHTSKPTEPLVTIATEAGREITSTSHHNHFAGYQLGVSPQMHFVYLMRKDGVGYRLGTTSVYTQGQKKPMLGFVQRLNQEHGDALWVVGTHNTAAAARESEYLLSLQYQLPTIPFVARTGESTNGYVHDQSAIDRIYAACDTTTQAEVLLTNHHQSLLHPHHRPQVSKSARQNILVSLCGDRRGSTPMHRISVAGSNPETKAILESAGYSVRPARAGSVSWRYETCPQSHHEMTQHVRALQKLLPDAVVIEQGRLGTQTSAGTREKNSLPVTPAAAVQPGMVLFAADGTYDIVTHVTHGVQPKTVYDLTVTPTHNFIAGGIVTHNSI
jgi:DNA helicase-2/ATP-dependent DNA helicase PcrA